MNGFGGGLNQIIIRRLEVLISEYIYTWTLITNLNWIYLYWLIELIQDFVDVWKIVELPKRVMFEAESLEYSNGWCPLRFASNIHKRFWLHQIDVNLLLNESGLKPCRFGNVYKGHCFTLILEGCFFVIQINVFFFFRNYVYLYYIFVYIWCI